MSEISEMVVHDVGAANFIPEHLLQSHIHFVHFDPDKRGLRSLARKKFQPMSASFHNYALGEDCERH